jgi:uncharacterized protein
MKLKLHGLQKKGSTTISLEKPPGEFELPENAFDRMVNIQLSMEMVGDLINADFHLWTVSHQICDRCAREFDLPMDIHQALRFIPDSGKSYSTEEDIKYFHPDNPEVDVTADIHDALILALPMKILCREECRGLCPKCGADLNYEDCQCSKEIIDPRWSSLEALRKSLD